MASQLLTSAVNRSQIMKLYAFETFDYTPWHKQVADNWQMSIYLSLVYLGAIFFAKKLMKDKTAFKLTKFYILWNTFFSLLSISFVLRVWKESLHEIVNYGFHHSYCYSDGHHVSSSIWAWIFTFSKFLEFGDTFLIILRKQELIFLHYYHHITVAMFTIYGYVQMDPASKYFSLINSLMLFLLYGYYSLKECGIKLPRQVASTITGLQILQMFAGILINCGSIFGKLLWNDCRRSWLIIFWCSIMYLSYLVLYIQFYSKTYSKDKTKTQKTVRKEDMQKLD